MVSNILVLGGTGAMGRHLVEILSQLGVHCVVTSRSEHPGKTNVEYVLGNAKEKTFIQPLLSSRQWDAIVDFMIYTTQEFNERVKWLLDSTDQYVYLSSSRVYADSIEPIKENSPRLLDVCDDPEYLKTDEYALAKARQEDLLLYSGLLNWTIVRPYITFSENRLQLGTLEKEHWLYRALHGRPIVFSKDVEEHFTTLTYGRDVARGIASLLGQSSAYGEVFHITVDESHTWKEILNVYLDTIERKTGSRPAVHIDNQWNTYIGGGRKLSSEI